MAVVRVENKTYKVGALYQWDKNQVLQIYGLSLPSIPEIHFSNKTMRNAIVKQARMDPAGVVSVDIPNVLLEQPCDIIVYVCTYEGDAFQCLYKMEIPVNPKKKPDDYVTPPDNTEEVYSYKALENLIVNNLALALERYDETDKKYKEVNAVMEQAVAASETAKAGAVAASEAAEAAKAGAVAASEGVEAAKNEAVTASAAAEAAKAEAVAAKAAAEAAKNEAVTTGKATQTAKNEAVAAKAAAEAAKAEAVAASEAAEAASAEVEQKKTEIVGLVLAALPTWEGGSY